MRSSHKRCNTIFLWLTPALLLLAAGCGGSPSRGSDPAAAIQSQVRQLETTGDYAGIAQLYLGLKGTPEQTREWQLRAAEALLEGGDTERASAIAENISQSALAPAELARVRMVIARAALLSGDRERAISSLPSYSDQLPATLQEEVLQLRVEVFSQARHVEDELLDRLTLERIAASPGVRRANELAIWRLLADIPVEQLQSLVSLDPELAGWVALQEVARVPLNEPDLFNERMAAWWTRFPGHPAADRGRAIEKARAFPAPTSRIALLLPLSGRYAVAGEAIREGFLAALNGARSIPPALIEYDTNLQSVTDLYRQAVLQGADVVVGPLLKANVESLRELPDRQVPVLTLNRAPGTGRGTDAGFYQFGLAPEDEAHQIARDLLSAGLRRALVIYPADQWGGRVSSTFVDEYTAGEGEIVASEAYIPDQGDYSEAVKRLLHVEGSEARKKRLQSLIGRELSFEARRRQDADVVFLAGFAQPIRLIYPQLRFHGIGDLPVVSTSSVYGGEATQIQDRDLDGLWFVDLPWVLDRTSASLGRDSGSDSVTTVDSQTNPVDEEQASTQEQPMTPRAPTPRLFALGADAYGVLPWLPALRESPGTTFDGTTGTLSIDASGHVVRRLHWARFQDGLATPERAIVGPAP